MQAVLRPSYTPSAVALLSPFPCRHQPTHHLSHVVDRPESVGRHRHRLHKKLLVAPPSQAARQPLARRVAGGRRRSGGAGAPALPPRHVCRGREGMDGCGNQRIGQAQRGSQEEHMRMQGRVPNRIPLDSKQRFRTAALHNAFDQPHQWGRCARGWAR